MRRAAAAGEPVAVACSGGADSVALVCALWAHLPEVRGRWLVLHFDHGLRGRDSTADARFVAQLARGLGERSLVERWQRTGPAEAGASEAGARDARFAFFARAMAEAGARVLVLGHQADDVIETMLMRLIRGSATGGLAAPRPVHRRGDGTVRVRPLLALEGAEVREALRAARTPWREDATNAGDMYLRNRLRRRVVPALRGAAGRELAGGFLAARQAIEDDDAALDQWVDEVAGPADARQWPALADKPRALARRAVHRWLLAVGLTGDLGRIAVDALIETVAEGGRLRLSAGTGRFVTFDGRQLRVEVAGRESCGWGAGCVLAVGSEVAKAGAVVRARLVRLTAALRRDILAGRFPPTQTVFLAAPAGPFIIRCRQPGDRYRPLGAPGRVRLQDILVNRKIPRELRDTLPVVCDPQNSPLWVPGLPPADDRAVRPGTKLVLQLTYHPAATIVRTP
jgi:tRNA(Ile)-lysidine synthase